MDDYETPVVMDLGSGFLKVGLAGEKEPTTVFPSIVGYPRSRSSSMSQRDSYVGDEAQSRRDDLSIKYPLENGLFKQSEEMEKLLHYTFFHALRVAPEEQPVLLTETPDNTKNDRRNITQVMFETFATPAMYLSMQPSLALYATGRVSGTVVDCGHGVTHAVSIYQGQFQRLNVLRRDLAGLGLTQHLLTMLGESGHDLSVEQTEIGRGIKENLCRVALNFEQEAQTAATSEEAYELPDGQVISIRGDQLISCPEALFQPSLAGRDYGGIHITAMRSIEKSERLESRKDLAANIVLTGGSTMFPGFVERMQQELTALDSKAKVIAGPGRRYLVWKGASTLASMSIMKDLWITKADYDESGPAIVHKKCL